jgi:hypothetical protein
MSLFRKTPCCRDDRKPDLCTYLCSYILTHLHTDWLTYLLIYLLTYAQQQCVKVWKYQTVLKSILYHEKWTSSFFSQISVNEQLSHIRRPWNVLIVWASSRNYWRIPHSRCLLGSHVKKFCPLNKIYVCHAVDGALHDAKACALLCSFPNVETIFIQKFLVLPLGRFECFLLAHIQPAIKKDYTTVVSLY